MELSLLLAARLEADPDAGGPFTHLPEHALLEVPDPTAAWIAAAVRAIAAHQQGDRAHHAWPLLRRLEPLLASLDASDPASAGRVHGALAAQALLEGAAETFLDREKRAAEALGRAGNRRTAVELAAFGGACVALGLETEAERALDAAMERAHRDALNLAAAASQAARAKLSARRGALAQARSLMAAAVERFAAAGQRRAEAMARADFAEFLAALGDGTDAEAEARLALDLAGPRAAAALGRGLLAQRRTREAIDVLIPACAHATAIGWLDGGGAGVWLALADAGVAEANAEAARLVLAFAATLKRPEIRKRYLEGIPEHRRALQPEA